MVFLIDNIWFSDERPGKLWKPTGEDSLQGKMSMPAVEESRSVKYVPGRDQEIEYVVKLDPQSGK